MRQCYKAFSVLYFWAGELDGEFCHLLVAPDGEAWHVNGLFLWLPEEVISTPMKMVEDAKDRHMIPVWETVQPTAQATRCDLPDPYESVAYCWGHEVASRLLDQK